jgi:hypothetical protein
MNLAVLFYFVMRDSDGFFKLVSSMTDVMKINHFAPEGFTPVVSSETLRNLSLMEENV